MTQLLALLLAHYSIISLLAESFPIVPYGPDIVRLTGTLRESTCPGPPEYESIENGDAPEHIYVLVLDSPIHVEDIPLKENSWDEPEDNVLEIQVAAHPKDAQHLVHEHVAITGTLFHAHTGHHRTEVVMLDNLIEHLN